jgi:hypothetical protein
VYKRYWNGVNYHTKEYDSKLLGNSHFAVITTTNSGGIDIAQLEKFVMIHAITLAGREKLVPVVFYKALKKSRTL